MAGYLDRFAGYYLSHFFMLGSAQMPGGPGGGAAYAPSLIFTDARNSQYVGQVV